MVRRVEIEGVSVARDGTTLVAEIDESVSEVAVCGREIRGKLDGPPRTRSGLFGAMQMQEH